VFEFERETIEPHAGAVANRKAVMIALIPALEKDAVIGAFRDLKPHHLRVIRGSEFEIGHGDVDMAQPEDSHVTDATSVVPRYGNPSRHPEHCLETSSFWPRDGRRKPPTRLIKTPNPPVEPTINRLIVLGWGFWNYELGGLPLLSQFVDGTGKVDR
jgi:hypothetical protein